MEANKELLQGLAMLQFLFIVAFRDDSSESKNGSRELARFLKCPLLDQNDITKAFLRNPSKFELSQNLAFEVICEIASTQLSLKFGFVINSSSLLDDAHVLKLMELASPQKAHLIVIQPTASDEVKEHGHGGGQILKLILNKDSSFDVKEAVSEISNLLAQKEKYEDRGMKEITETHRKLPNLHALNFLEKPRKPNLTCKKCSKFLFGPSYHCIECDEFTFHKSCAEVAPNVQVLSSQNCPSFFKDLKFDHYDSQLNTFKCSNCEEFSYECYDCLFQTNFNREIVPTTLVYPEKHQHPLNFVIMPFRYNYQYQCCVCDKLGYSVSYKCFECYDYNFDAHLNCILPNTIHRKTRDQQYSFFLNSFSCSPNKGSCCDICNKETDEGQLLYQCKDLLLNIHFRCLLDENQVDVIINKKKVLIGNHRPFIKEEVLVGIYNDEFPCKADQFFNILSSDDFTNAYHAARKDTNLTVGKWHAADEYEGQVRKITFRSLCNSPMCPPDTAITEYQHAVLFPDKEILVFETAQQAHDIPFGSYFEIHSRWRVENSDENLSTIDIKVGAHFKKWSVMQPKIKAVAIGEYRKEVELILETARSFVKSNIPSSKADKPSSLPILTQDTS